MGTGLWVRGWDWGLLLGGRDVGDRSRVVVGTGLRVGAVGLGAGVVSW